MIPSPLSTCSRQVLQQRADQCFGYWKVENLWCSMVIVTLPSASPSEFTCFENQASFWGPAHRCRAGRRSCPHEHGPIIRRTCQLIWLDTWVVMITSGRSPRSPTSPTSQPKPQATATATATTPTTTTATTTTTSTITTKTTKTTTTPRTTTTTTACRWTFTPLFADKTAHFYGRVF